MLKNITQIRKLREKLNWSRQKLADAAKVHVNTIIRLESGQTKPQREKLNGILEALKRAEQSKLSEIKVVKAVDRKTTISRKKDSAISYTTQATKPGLGNVDFQIINCILNMSDKAKIKLLIKLGD